MPRTKKGSRGSRRGSCSNARHSTRSASPYIASLNSNPGIAYSGYSLQEEALNTQHRTLPWDVDQRLRHLKVNFISAGATEPSKYTDPATAIATMTLEEVTQETGEDPNKTAAALSPFRDSALIAQNEPITDPEETAQHFIIDTRGDQTIHSSLLPPRIKSTSPTLSDSSDEVLLFAGRDLDGRGISRPPPNSRTITDPFGARVKAIEERIHEQKKRLAIAMGKRGPPCATQPENAKGCLLPQSRNGEGSSEGKFQETLETAVETNKSILFEPTPQKMAQTSYRNDIKQNTRQAMFDDYIASMEEGEMETNGSFSHRDLGGIDRNAWQETDISSGEASKERLETAWSRSELQDFEDFSTSNKILGTVAAILSKRNQKSGPQYLIVLDGDTLDDARRVSTSKLANLTSANLVEQFDVEEKLVSDISNEGRGSDSEADDDSVGGDDLTGDGNSDRIQRRRDHMTNDMISRLLAKQEELGMVPSDLRLFDDFTNREIGEIGMVAGVAPTRSHQVVRKQHHGGRSKDEFPSATALADAYDGFDIMDFERPSLKKKSKGRRGNLPLDLSDSDLEASMQMALRNDRSKKRTRKVERQQLRSQGLLSKKGGKLDLKAKYLEGMSMSAIKDEIRDFLVGDNTTLALPPMEKSDRKVVHELANAFNLKSKSAGNGNKRFPVLYRTSRTSPYIESKFDSVEARLTRRYLPRMDVGGKNPGLMPQRSGRGGFIHAAVSYRDGDVVGGSAPELGVENKGRAMLEKMGWSTGTALGALNNKGILQPVSHVVKTTKAGLG